MKVLEVIQKSSEFLAKRGVDSPRLQIELLLAHQLKIPRLRLYLNFDQVVSEPDLASLRGMVVRRGDRVPLQQLIGSTSFAGIEIAVGPEVLIPRPETELLAEQSLGFLAAQTPFEGKGLRVLDYGTGSGCLAVFLATRCPQLQVHALDISEAALNIARQNAATYGLSDRITFHHGDGFLALPQGMQFDAMVSNPPYIPTDAILDLQPEVRDHDPKLALDGGADGLTFYRRLASEAGAWVYPKGRIFLEIGDGQSEAVTELLRAQNWVVESVCPDYSAVPRVVVASRG